ncbi:sensor histidine kinase [Motilibacter rhizosphaerae]|nr:sensor histidine kinase [Motilibacter rhizosphaerae]
MNRWGEAVRAWWRAHPALLDLLLAAVIVLLGGLSLPDEVHDAATDPTAGHRLHGPDGLAVLLMLGSTLPVATRRRSPLGSYAVVLVSATVAAAAHYPAGIAGVSGLVLLYSVGVLLERTPALVALGAGAAAYVAVSLLDPYDDTFIGGVVNGGIYVAAWALGRTIRYRRAYTRELEARAERLQADRDVQLRATLVEERARIARELHDVVAHSLSVMTVQAAAAQRTADRDLERSKEAMAAVESTGRAALVEMRRIVGVLREQDTDHAAPARLAPQPGLADLPELIGKVREAGLEVEMDLAGAPARLPAGVDLTVYRIVQEALTNTLKHAGPTSACVRVSCWDSSVDVEVEDSGRGAAAFSSPTGRSGHGLVGMQERVALYGGSLRVGPRPGGGYSVSARIPVDVGGPTRAVHHQEEAPR